MYPRRTPYEDDVPRRENIITVAMPGVTSSRAQISRYCGSDGITVLQNWSDGFEPLHDVEVHRNRHDGVPRLLRWKGAVMSFVYYCILGRESDAILPPLTGSVVHPHHDDDEEAADATGMTSSARLMKHSDERRRLAQMADAGELDPPVLYHATCAVAPRLLHNVLPSPEVSEIVHQVGWHVWLHPLRLVLWLKEMATCVLFSTRPIQWCYSEVGRSNMGGERDQAYFTREVRRAVCKIQQEAQQHRDGVDDDEAEKVSVPRGLAKRRHLVLFGVSRGAATCFYASMKLPAALASYVSLVVVEAPFDTMTHVLQSSSFVPTLNRWFFNVFADYGGAEEERRAYNYKAEEVRLRCPIAFVLSRRDRRVPNECTNALIEGVRQKLVPAVIPAVEVLMLQHSRHPCMAVGCREDQDAYVRFMEGLYTKYCP